MTTATGSYATTASVKTRLNITTSTDDTVIGTLCDQANQFIETWTGRVFSSTSATYTFDGRDALEDGRCLPMSRGIQSISLLQVATYTGGALQTVPSTDYFLRPSAPDRQPGWPATELWMTDIPSSSNAVPVFFLGYNNVSITGVFGWASPPDDIVGVALNLAVAGYRGRGSGGGDQYTVGMDGERTFERFLGLSDKHVLDRYKVKQIGII